MDTIARAPRLWDGWVTHLSPTRSELVRYFAWGYFSRRELTGRLRQDRTPEARPGEVQGDASTAA